MKRLYKRTAVTIVTALLVFGLTINGFALDYTEVISNYDYWNSSYLVPSPNYPSSESLPYGEDTLIYEILYETTATNSTVKSFVIYRFYLKKDLYSGSDVSAFNGATTCFVFNSSGKFEAFVASPSTVYYELYVYIPSYNLYRFTDIKKAPYYKTKDGKTYNFVVISGDFDSTGNSLNKYRVCWSNYSCLYGGRDLKSLVESGLIHNAPSDELPAYTYGWLTSSGDRYYPSSSVLGNIADEEYHSSTSEKLDKIESNVIEGFSSVNDSINQGVTRIEGAITQAVDDILNAGSDMPTLDTDNEWMNDSLTKVNEWLSTLEEFDKQMDAAEEENAENMAQAKTFLTSFFSKIPKGIIAALTLALVMIVAVKAVGR